MTPLWQIIFRKELGEVLRDRRTHFSVFIIPLLVTPLLFAMMGKMMRNQTTKMQNEDIVVAFVGVKESPTLSDTFAKPEKMLVTDAKSKDEAEKMVKEKTVRAALIFPTDSEKLLQENRQVVATVLTEQGRQPSQEAGARLEDLVEKRGARLVALRLQENGLPQQLATPFATVDKNIKGGAPAGTLFATLILPYMLTLYAITGGVALANDTVAGEKERGTLETLLVSPASRQEIVTGKFLAVTVMAMLSGALAIVGFIWPYKVHLSAFEWMAKSGLSLTPISVLAMFLVQIPLAVMGAGLLLTVSTFARNQREAQTYLSPVFMLGTSGAMLSLFLGTDAPLYWAFVPVTNTSLVLKQALEGTVNLPFLVAACSTSIIYAAAAVAFAAHSFRKESILLKA